LCRNVAYNTIIAPNYYANSITERFVQEKLLVMLKLKTNL
jgi:hypothetical protein